MGERLLLSDFEPHIGSRFSLTGDVGDLRLDMELVSVEELPSGSEQGTDDTFSLVFRGPLEHKLPQMIRHLEHPKIGGIDLFLVPVREDEQGRYYEAIFNYVD